MVKILTIEDEQDILDIICEVLIENNFEVIEANNPQIGIQLAIDHTPDLIICDVIMPEMNGYEILNQLRQNPMTEVIPFIFLTAKTEKRDMRQGMELGADDYLTKPFTIDELLQAVKTCLKKYSSLKKFYTNQVQQTQTTQKNVLRYNSATNLPNQLFLREIFDDVVERSTIDQGESEEQSLLVPVFCLSLDRFERINKNLGYGIGNLLITAVSERLKNLLGSKGFVIRLNTDDFAIILQAVNSKKAVIQFAKNILENFAQSFFIQEHEIFITPSIGISLYPQDNHEIGKLLQHANKGMTHVRQLGGNNYHFYTVLFNISTSDIVSLETELHHALERQELQVYYQPQLNLQTNQVIGVEALLRWHHPKRGLISPDQFLPLAEETGLIESLGDWILHTACRQVKMWQNQGLDNLNIAVNLSARQFNQINLRQKLTQILSETALEANYLELELTEDVLVNNSDVALRRLKGLKSLGVTIALDDFGIGYSSLGYLQQFPFDLLKIDPFFICGIDKNEKNRAIVQTIISLAHKLNLKVIAEGVEKQEELDFLSQHQCDIMQGYLFSHPIIASEFEKSPFMSAIINNK